MNMALNVDLVLLAEKKGIGITTSVIMLVRKK